MIEIAGEEKGRAPVHNIQQVVCFGRPGASPGVMSLCAENDVTMTFMKPNGRFLASVHGETRGNVLLRRAQYRLADNEDASLKISRNMIDGKLINCRAILRKGVSNHPDLEGADEVHNAIERLTSSIDVLKTISSREELRGIEGDAARTYFHALDCLVLKDRAHFHMEGRSRRPPRDRFNSLLSFLYSMLANDVRSALESTGLDPYVGFLHTDRPGRPSLALDIMEELRPIADRMALRLVNLGMVFADGFVEEGAGSFLMDDNTRATVIDGWQKSKSVQTVHPFLGESIPTGLIPFAQSMLLAKNLRGDIEGYPPYIIKR